MSTHTGPLFEGHTRQIDATSSHHIEWEFDQDTVSAKAICESGPDANCRQYAACDCESYNIDRDETGAVYHLSIEWDDVLDKEMSVRHPMRAGEACNVCEWLNEGDIEEQAFERQRFVIARTPIESHWDYDHVTWSPSAEKVLPTPPDGFPAPWCSDCGPGYRIGDEGCRHDTYKPKVGEEGVCRTCAEPIWWEIGTVGHREVTDWSDRNERGGDSVVCFKARSYRHVPMGAREAAIYRHGFDAGKATS